MRKKKAFLTPFKKNATLVLSKVCKGDKHYAEVFDIHNDGSILDSSHGSSRLLNVYRQ